VALAEGATACVIAGEAGGVRGPVADIVTRPLYLDVRMAGQARVTLGVEAGDNALAYVYAGRATLGPDATTGGREIAAGQLAVLGDGHRLTATTGDAPARFLLLAAQPLREPIARYGPFVMNTREEIVQAVEDYQRGTFLR
jgi:redox-sensitive bicupin YhaK (pirin superfamily)